MILDCLNKLEEFGFSSQSFDFSLGNKNESNYYNVAKFEITPILNDGNAFRYCIIHNKIIIDAGYNYTAILGALEINLSFQYRYIKNSATSSIDNKSIEYISDTKTFKSLNIDIETKNEKCFLVIKYKSLFNNFTLKNINLYNNLSKFKKPILSYEDISKIQEWH